MKSILRNCYLGLAVTGLLLAPLACKKEKPKENTTDVKTPTADEGKPREHKKPGPGEKKQAALQEREEQLKARQEAKEREANIKDVHRPRYTPEMIVASSSQAQSTIDQAKAAVGQPKTTVVVTFQDKVANELTLVSVQVAAMDGDNFKGTVQRIDPKDKGSQLTEKAEVTVAAKDVVDWSLVNESGMSGQYLMREWLKFQAEHGDNDDAKNEAKSRLAKLGEPVPAPATGSGAATDDHSGHDH